jgi:hypothetical protein
MYTLRPVLRLLIAGALLADLVVASAQSTPSPAQTPQVQSSACEWTFSGKHDQDEVAIFPSSSNTEHLEIYFFKHEFGSMAVRVPASVAMKSHSKDPSTQLKKNKIKVVVTFDGAAPMTQEWGAVDYPKGAISPMLTPQDRSPKLYQKALESKQLTISYPDISGNIVTVVFDLSALKPQMDAHKEHVHHFGAMDAVELLGGLSGG